MIMNITATARMVKVTFESIYKERLDGHDEIIKLYEKHSSFKVYNGDLFWSIKQPHNINYNDWYELDKNGGIDKFLIDHPLYDSFNLTMTYNEYMELEYKYHNLNCMKIIERFDINYIPESSTADVERALSLINVNIQLFEKQLKALSEIGEQHYNLKCNAPVADTFLSKVNQLMLLEDSCTDKLQEALHEGWRIISVTPQPNQRRPDYVLGKVVDTPDKYALRSL